MAREKVSIILPSYNRAYILGQALESILNQTYPDFELLVIDDGSTDGTEDLVQMYQDERIIYYKLEQNGGVSAARNYGIQQARYDYIAFEDSDDAWHEDKLQKQMEALTQADTETGFCYHKMRYDMGENQYIILPAEQTPLEKKSGDIYAQLLYDNLVDCPTILARRECVQQAGGFDTEMKALEDYDFALKMAKRKKAVFINEVLLESTFSAAGVSGSPLNYLTASCHLLRKYKADYLATGTLNHRIEIILRDAEAVGMMEPFVKLLEQIMKA